MGIAPANVSEAKGRDAFPLEWVLKLSQVFNISTDWILFGEGPMLRVDRAGSPDHIYNNEDDQAGEDGRDMNQDEFYKYILAYIQETGRHPDYRGWFKIEFLKRFPEFHEWLKKQRRLDAKNLPPQSEAVG